ncbi:MAG: DUF705 domain-containing protein [Polyangiaceae bacterium]
MVNALLIASPLIVYVDVDDTLVRSFGSKRIPISGMVQHVRELHRAGAVLYCWSSGGAQYAEQSARELGIGDCFTGFLPKPNVAIDDVALSDWPRFVRVHPNEAASMSSADYVSALDEPGGR